MSGVRRALHPVPVLAAIMLAAFLLQLPVLLKVPDWVVMTDELLYTKLGLAVADNLSPAARIHGDSYGLLSQLYPVLLAPILALFDMPTAFKAAHVLNGLLLASTAIPAYLLARAATLPRAAAYGVAALSVVTPWVVLGTVIWAESVAYPAFVWALALMQRAIVAPSARNDVLALSALALAFFARTQFALLAIVFPIVLVVHRLGFALTERKSAEARDRPVRSAVRSVLREHRVLLGVYAFAGVAALVILSSGGRSRLLGPYASTTDGDLLPRGVDYVAEQHLAALAVAIGVVPLVLALGWAVPTLVRPLGRERHALAVLGLVVTPALLLQASSFTLRFARGGVHDRYVFYVAPLLFVGMVACLLEGRRRWPFVLAAGLVMVHVVGTLTYEPSAALPFFVSPASVFWLVLEGRAYELGQMVGIADLSPYTVIRWGTVVVAVGLAAGLLLVPRRVMAPAVILLLLVFSLGETRWVLAHAWFDTKAPTPDHSGKDWVDDALPDGAEAGLVPVFVGNSEFDAQRIWWPPEFWNKSVTETFSANGANVYTPFAAETMTVDPMQGTVESSKIMDHLVVASTDLRFRLAGPTVAQSGYLELIRPDRPYRVSWATRNLVPDGWTIEGSVPTLRLFGQPGTGPGRRVSVRLYATGEVFSRRGYTLSDGRRRSSGVVELGEEETATLVTCVPPGGTSDVRLDVRGSNLLPNGRRIGLRVMEIKVEPAAARGCGAGEGASGDSTPRSAGS